MSDRLEINPGKAPPYIVIDDEGNVTGEVSEQYRDLTPEEAKRLFGIEGRTVRVGISAVSNPDFSVSGDT